MILPRIFFFAGLALFSTVPAFADTNNFANPIVVAPRFVSNEALLGLVPVVEAPQATPVVEAPQAHIAPAVSEPRPASPDLFWASAVRAFAER